MSQAPADFVVFGSAPLARLVAGLLAGVHGRRVLWIGDSHAAFRMPRGIDLSVGPLTRPESWALLAQSVPETVKLLARAGGKAGTQRLDPIFFADSPSGQQALAFLGSSAAGFANAIEPLPSGHLGKVRSGIVLRDALYLQRDRLEPILDTWLDSLKVTRLPLAHAGITLAADGSVSIVQGSETFAAAQAILADDETITAHLPVETLVRLFQLQPMTTILTEPTLAMAAPVMLQVDADLSFVQGPHRGISAIGAGSTEACAAQIGVLLGANRQLRQAGGAQHQSLRSPDGGAVLGRAGSSGPLLLAGLGVTGAFLAPALARWIMDAARPDEATYFAARSPDRAMLGSPVSEYLPAGPTMAAA